jgi:hypothetical protein
MMTPRQRTIALARAERRCKAPDDQSAGPPLAPERACPMCRLEGRACRQHRLILTDPCAFAALPPYEAPDGGVTAYTRTEPDRRRKGARDGAA